MEDLLRHVILAGEKKKKTFLISHFFLVFLHNQAPSKVNQRIRNYLFSGSRVSFLQEGSPCEKVYLAI